MNSAYRHRAGTLAATLVLALTAGTALADGTLNVYNWSDYIGEETIATFEAKAGVKVNYDVYDSNDILEAKLLAGNSGYDLIHPTAMPTLARLIQAGAVQKLDKSKIPNLANLDPKLMELVKSADPNLDYSAIYQWGTNGLGMNTAKIKERLGDDAPVDSFELLFNPKYVSKLADCGVTVLDSADEVLPIAMHYLGYNPGSEDAKGLKAAEDLLMGMRSYVRYFHSSRYITDLANGEVCLSVGYSGDVFQARDRAAEANNGVVIDYAVPKEGTIIWFDVMAIPAGAPNLANAYKYINYILEPETMAGITNFVWYAHAVPKALPFTDPEIVSDPAIFPPPDVQAKLFPNALHSPRFTRDMTRAWTRIRTGQ
jgi:putrescine transport system substrate-binding protein